MSKIAIWKKIVLGFVALLLFLTCGLAYWLTRPQYYKSFDSPKGKYHLVVYSKFSLKQFAVAMPGGGGLKDAPGVVRLYDRGGKLYGEADVAWLQDFDSASDVHWSDDSVGGAGEGGFFFKFPKE